ncbi:MAG: 50S ribosomal protein L3 [Actinobacteria bacterium]|nr:50S ribosomal protein L3 [Actinomycetota bacterium]
MVEAIYGIKVGTTQVFDKKGNTVCVTAIEAEPCVVVDVKNTEKHGYSAIRVGFGKAREKKLNKPLKGEFDKVGVGYKRFIKEIRVENLEEECKPGDKIDVGVFKAGDRINITGLSKGKGFSGVIKRHNFHRGPMSHGSHSQRRPGSIGMCSTPSRVFKGKKMPGRMGNRRVTILNSEVVDVIGEKNLILVKGSVPGARGNVVLIRKVQG